MPQVVAGDTLELTWNHKTLGSGRLFHKASEDTVFDLGGFRGDDDKSSVDGGGRNIKKLSRVRWTFEGVCSWDMNVTDELTKLEKMAGDPLDADWTIAHSNGTVWAGTGSPVGDLQGKGNDGTIALKLSGGGQLKKIIG